MVKKLYPSHYIFWLVAPISFALNASALADEGLSLHAENCVACHAAMTGGEGTVLYTREDHTVQNFEALGQQVNRCQSSLGLNWTNEQVEIVQEYLNSAFYKF